MSGRIGNYLPSIILFLIIASLVNVGALPGKTTILKVLGLYQAPEEEESRSLDYVPRRITEIQTEGTPLVIEEQPSASKPPATYFGQPVASPRVFSSPSPRIIYQTPSVYVTPPSNPNVPPIPPPHIFGVKDEVDIPPVPTGNIGEFNNSTKGESILETFKKFFSGIF